MFANILTMGQVLPWIPSQSCMHMGTCAKGSIGARAHKAILYKIVDILGKLKQLCTMFFVLSTFLLPCFEAHIAVGFDNEPWRHGHFGQILEEKSSFQTTMFWWH